MFIRIGAADGPIALPLMFSIFNVELIIMPWHKYSNPSFPMLCYDISISNMDLFEDNISPSILASELPDVLDFLVGKMIFLIYSVRFKMLTSGSNFPVELLSEGSNTSKFEANEDAI